MTESELMERKKPRTRRKAGGEKVAPLHVLQVEIEHDRQALSGSASPPPQDPLPQQGVQEPPPALEEESMSVAAVEEIIRKVEGEVLSPTALEIEILDILSKPQVQPLIISSEEHIMTTAQTTQPAAAQTTTTVTVAPVEPGFMDSYGWTGLKVLGGAAALGGAAYAGYHMGFKAGQQAGMGKAV